MKNSFTDSLSLVNNIFIDLKNCIVQSSSALIARCANPANNTVIYSANIHNWNK